MKVCVLQSNYLPWPGYFQLITNSDVVCFLDDVQFTKNDWRNRNLIASKQGPVWLSVPVHGSTNQKIHEVKIDNSQRWQRKHFTSVMHNYASSPCLGFLGEFMDFVWKDRDWTYLSDLNQKTIEFILRKFLCSPTRIVSSESMALGLRGKARLLKILHDLGATEYLSGPAIFNYASGGDFKDCGIELRIVKYDDFSRYSKKIGSQINLSIIDLFLNMGNKTPEILKEKYVECPWDQFLSERKKI
jgi:hypothetical protein